MRIVRAIVASDSSIEKKHRLRLLELRRAVLLPFVIISQTDHGAAVAAVLGADVDLHLHPTMPTPALPTPIASCD